MTTRTRYKDDSGAALVIVMIIITVVAAVTGALLSQADTSVKATVALRDQAGSAYNGDGAAQAAINELRTGTYNNVTNTQCFGAIGTLPLPGFYPATYGQNGTAKGSASVVCAAETGTGAQGTPVPISDKNKPGNAVLTLGKAANDGQVYGQSNQDLNIRGGVISNANIDSSKAKLNVTGGATVSAVGTCSGPITPACTTLASPLPDPNYPAPTASPAPPTSLPACSNKNAVAEFTPGLYLDADFLNNCKASWMLFDPGTYYFDFTSTNKVWSINGTVVGGSVPGINPGSAPAGAAVPSVPGACVNPITDISAVGVQFAFGGSSQVSFVKGSNFEVCASYAGGTVPTVVYGLKSNIGTAPNVAHAQTGCVIDPDPVVGCELFSDFGNGTKPTFFFEGFVYAPRASVNIAVNNTTKPYFNWGVVLRRLNLTTTGSASSDAIISLPDNSLGYGTASTIVDLTVYVCPGVTTSTCSTHASRRLQLTARVQITDPSGAPVAGKRQMTVLSWGMRR